MFAHAYQVNYIRVLEIDENSFVLMGRSIDLVMFENKPQIDLSCPNFKPQNLQKHTVPRCSMSIHVIPGMY